MRLNPRVFWRYRPRALTLIVFLAVTTVLILSNGSYVSISSFFFGMPSDYRRSGEWIYGAYGGWPLLWYRMVITDFGSPNGAPWQIHPARLAGNVALWSIVMVAGVGGCEWLLRRYRPRLRWTLRGLLIAVALAATFCGWFATARNRANEQDPLIASLDRVRLRRWGPRWLDLVGADRFRRHIIAAEAQLNSTDERDDLLNRLSRVRTLECLALKVDEVSPSVVEFLSKMRQLRILSIDADGERISRECLTAIGQMTGLEHLRLESMKIGGGDLALLAGLTNLKSISFEFVRTNQGSILRGLPALPSVQTVEISFCDVGDADLPYLNVLRGLKSLDLHSTYVTDASLRQLERLESLEELGIDDEMITAKGLSSLLTIKRLQKLHLRDCHLGGPWGALPIATGVDIRAPEREVSGCLRALKALRQAKLAIMIDNNWMPYLSEDQVTIPSDDESVDRPNAPVSFPWLRASFWGGALPEEAKSLAW